MRVVKWGNALAIRIPASVIKFLGLKDGDEVHVHVADKENFAIAKQMDREGMMNQLRAFRGALPADFKFDRDDTNAR